MSEQGLSLPSTIKTFDSNNPLKKKKKKKRNLPGTPDPEAQVIALSPKSLMATNRFVCEICKKGFQRDQNLQLHRRGHNLPWKLRLRTDKEPGPKKVYVCPVNTCVHHDPCRALGDLTGIKKHYSRKHGDKKWNCPKCSKKYAVHSDWKAHLKICGTREYKCHCGTLFSRKDSFMTHRAFCEVLEKESGRISFVPEAPRIPQIFTGYSPVYVNSSVPDLMQTSMNMLVTSSWVKPYPDFANMAMSGVPYPLEEEEGEEEQEKNASCLYGASNHENAWQVGGLAQPTSLLQMGSTGTNHIDIFGSMAASLPSLSNTTTTAPFTNGDQNYLTDSLFSQGNTNVDAHGLVLNNDCNSSQFVRGGDNLQQMELGGLTRDFLGVGEKEFAKFNAIASSPHPWSSLANSYSSPTNNK